MKKNIGKPLLGSILVAIGVLYLLGNTGVIPLSFREIISNYWPVAIILWAGVRFVQGFFMKTSVKSRFNRIYWSLGFLLIGGILLENRINLLMEDPVGLWGVIFAWFIIYIGLSIVFFRSNTFEFKVDGGNVVVNSIDEDDQEECCVHNEECNEETDDEENDEIKARIKEKQKKRTENIRRKYGNKKSYEGYSHRSEKNKEYTYKDIKTGKDRFHFIGELRRGDRPWALENSSYRLGIGEIYIDLTTALLEEGVTYLNLSGWVGSIQIIVPEDLAIDLSADVNIGSVDLFGDEQEFTRHTSKKSSGVSSNLLCYRSENYDESLKKSPSKCINEYWGSITKKGGIK